MPHLPTHAGNCWDEPHRDWTMLHAREVLCTRPVAAGTPRVWKEAPESLDATTLIIDGGRRTTLNALMSDSEADGVLLIRRGAIAFERYSRGMQPATRHTLFSATRSWVGALVGILAKEGFLDLRAPVRDVASELAGSAFADATVRQLLDMRSGVNSSVVQELMSGGFMQRAPDAPDGLHAFILAQQASVAHGGAFNYRTADTAVLGWVCEAAAGAPLDALLSRYIWGPVGAQHDADFVVDAHGDAAYTSGLCATLRDAGCFAQAMQGATDSPLPPAWLEDTRRGTPDAQAAFKASSGGFFGQPVPEGMYRNQHWVLNPARGITLAYGAYGQLLYSDPTAEFCAVVLSRWKAPVTPWVQAWLQAFATLSGADSAAVTSRLGDASVK